MLHQKKLGSSQQWLKFLPKFKYCTKTYRLKIIQFSLLLLIDFMIKEWFCNQLFPQWFLLTLQTKEITKKRE